MKILPSRFDKLNEEKTYLEKLAVQEVVQHYGGYAKMSAKLGTSENAIRQMALRGVVGKFLAVLIENDPTSPFTLEDLRPDFLHLREKDGTFRPGPKPPIAKTRAPRQAVIPKRPGGEPKAARRSRAGA